MSFIVLICLPMMLSAASFDCDKAKTEVESIICLNDKLSKLDDEMGKVYKEALDKATDKEALKKEQIAWLKYRNKIDTNEKNPYVGKMSWIYMGEIYKNRIFYLTAKDDKFHIKYSADNQTCSYFVKLLNDDISKNGDLNVSRLKEFNWVEWKVLNYERQGKWLSGVPYMHASYFDINNDGKNNGVFRIWYALRDYSMQHFIYVSEEEGRLIEQLNATKPTAMLYQKGINYGLSGSKKGNNIEENISSILARQTNCYEPYTNNNTRCYADINFPIAYPMYFLNQYYLAVFGTIEDGILIDTMDINKMDTLGNVVALVKYNPNDELEVICQLIRANPNTKKSLFWYINY